MVTIMRGNFKHSKLRYIYLLQSLFKYHINQQGLHEAFKNIYIIKYPQMRLNTSLHNKSYTNIAITHAFPKGTPIEITLAYNSTES